MPLIKPFRGYRYDPRRVDPSRVVAPPYDVIDDSLREELYQRDPRNVVRLIRGRGTDPYGDAADTCKRWMEEAILVRDQQPSFYYLEQEFPDPDGRLLTRKGFIGSCLIEEYGGSVLPHEGTHPEPKADRLRLMKATGAMFSQVFALYADTAGTLNGIFDELGREEPVWTAVYDGVRSILRLSVDERVNLLLASFMRDRKVLIADGHHRYETAMDYRNGMRLKNPDHNGHEPYNFLPVYFANMHDPGTLVLPTHRLLRGFDRSSFLRKLQNCFSLKPVAAMAELITLLRRTEGTAFGLVTGWDGGFHLLQLNGRGRELTARLPLSFAKFDTAVLHRLILEDAPGGAATLSMKSIRIEYEMDENKAVSLVLDGSFQAAFLLKSPALDEIWLAAEAGEPLPRKSTFFYPKLLSGLVTYAYEEEVGE